MLKSDWKKARVQGSVSIRDSLVAMGAGRQHILFVVSETDRLLGTVTDGDIRRAMLRSISLDQPIETIMTTAPIMLQHGQTWAEAQALMARHDIQHLPVVDATGRIVDLLRIEDFVSANPVLPNWVVLMAGGQGQRLRPMTESVPKPLLSVGNRPILETILTELATNGFRHFYISINYKSEMVKTHFGDGGRFGVEIRYIEEEVPMGTAGCLSLISENHDAPLLVMNSDLLTKVGFSHLLAFHQENAARVTVGVRTFDFQIPYGVVKLDQYQIQDIVEKPVQSVMVSAGICVIDPNLPAILPKQYLDMPDLLRQRIAANERVVAFPIHEYWIDVGRFSDLSRAAAEFDSHFTRADP